MNWHPSGNTLVPYTTLFRSSGNIGRAAGENTGGYAYSLGSVAASAPANYTTSLVTTDGSTITRQTPTIPINAYQTKSYGRNDTTLTYTSNGIVNGLTPMYWN